MFTLQKKRGVSGECGDDDCDGHDGSDDDPLYAGRCSQVHPPWDPGAASLPSSPSMWSVQASFL